MSGSRFPCTPACTLDLVLAASANADGNPTGPSQHFCCYTSNFKGHWPAWLLKDVQPQCLLYYYTGPHTASANDSFAEVKLLSMATAARTPFLYRASCAPCSLPPLAPAYPTKGQLDIMVAHCHRLNKTGVDRCKIGAPRGLRLHEQAIRVHSTPLNG